MSCHTDGSLADSITRFGGRNTSQHCGAHIPGAADRAYVDIYEVYPPLDYDNANISEKPRNAVMYGSVTINTGSGRGGTSTYYNPYSNFTLDSTSACGKDFTTIGSVKIVYVYIPSTLSFNTMEGDTWFVYVFDMGADGGNVGSPCYRIETQTRGGGGGSSQAQPTAIEETSTRCIPCNNFYCTPTSSTCTYESPTGNETGDPDAPYPLIFGIGTNSKKVVFRYDSLSTQLPNGVNDLSFVYAPDNIDQDVWNEATYTGEPIQTTQNPWIFSEDSTFTVIKIYEGSVFTSGNKQDLKIKVRITPIVDFDNSVITGTEWELMELMQPGLNYAVNDTFTLEYTHTHDDQTTDTISITLKITGVGPYSAVSSQEGFDILRAGDTINGHVITNTFHTDLENFEYHVVYVDGDGNNFAKDTQYTSDRNHQITVVAGFGIPDRASLIGIYEFMDKSIQFSTYSVDPTSPDIYNTLIQPDLTANLVNGQLDSVTIVDGGSGWNTFGKEPNLTVIPPPIESGTQAKVKGTFTNGVLTAVEVTDRGSGYTTSDPPGIYIRDTYAQDDIVFNDPVPTEKRDFDNYIEDVKKTGTFPEFDALFETGGALDSANEDRKKQLDGVTLPVNRNNGDLLTDPDQSVVYPLPQRKFPKAKVDKLRDTYETYEVDLPKNESIDQSFRSEWSNIGVNLDKEMDNHFKELTQEQIPDFDVKDATLIETTLRRFADLPHASLYTKYLINQYRADGNSETTLKITIGCNQQESGCNHMLSICPQPAGSAPTTNDEQQEYTDENGQTQTETVTYSYTYTMSQMLGPGCQDWTATGSMRILNNLTKAANTYASAVRAYGNPFDI